MYILNGKGWDILLHIPPWFSIDDDGKSKQDAASAYVCRLLGLLTTLGIRRHELSRLNSAI